MNPQLFSNQNFLTILYYNAIGLFPKIDELTALCTLHNPGIVCVVETWLSSDMADSELSIPNYQVICLDRNHHGGGVLCITRLSHVFMFVVFVIVYVYCVACSPSLLSFLLVQFILNVIVVPLLLCWIVSYDDDNNNN